MTLLLAATLPSVGGLPLGHLALWCGLVLLTLVLIVLVASRWGKSHPVATCGVLSLLAHVLLACVATIVRLVSTAEHVAEGPPIRVRIVDVETAAEVDTPLPLLPADDLQAVVDDETEAADTHPAVETLAQPVADDHTREIVSDPEEPLLTEAPLLLPISPELAPTIEQSATNEAYADPVEPEPTAVVPTDVVPREESAAMVSNEAPPDGTVGEAFQEPVVAVDMPEKAQSQWATSQPLPPAYVSTAPATATPYDHRQRPDRLGFVEREGGSRETEAAVRAALAWLAAAQSHDGRWDASRFGAGEERVVLGHNRQGAGARADTGVSGLALLALLGAGHTHQSGEYADTIGRGLQFLVSQQANDGSLGGEATLYAHMYCHSMATFALAEALAMTGDRCWMPSVERAVAYSITAQHPASGGWRYRPGQTGDTSQLGWQIMALRSAELGGLHIPPTTWTNVERFLRSVTRGTAGGLASYRPEAPTSRTMTAEALYCRQLLSSAVGGHVEPAATAEATRALVEEVPGSGPFNLYYWYYATLALHHHKDASADAQHAWRQWNDAMKRTLLSSQTTYGPDAGSWSPNTMWGGYGGRVYSTALATLCLEVYYRFAPQTDGGGDWIATRPDDSRQSR